MTKRKIADEIFNPPRKCRWIRNFNNKKATPIYVAAEALQRFPSGNYKVRFFLPKSNEFRERNVGPNTVVFD